MGSHKISIFWDMVTCPPQTDEEVSLVLDQILHGLENLQIQGKFLIFGYGVNNLSPKILARIKRLHIGMTFYGSNRRKGVMSFMNEIMSLKYKVVDGRKIACVLISGNERFGGLFHKLKWFGEYKTFLVHPYNNPRTLPDSSLVCAFEKVWSYAGLVNGVGPN